MAPWDAVKVFILMLASSCWKRQGQWCSLGPQHSLCGAEIRGKGSTSKSDCAWPPLGAGASSLSGPLPGGGGRPASSSQDSWEPQPPGSCSAHGGWLSIPGAPLSCGCFSTSLTNAGAEQPRCCLQGGAGCWLPCGPAARRGHRALGLTLGCRHCGRVAQVRARRIPGCDSPENRGTQRAGKSCNFWGFRVSFLFFSKKKEKKSIFRIFFF